MNPFLLLLFVVFLFGCGPQKKDQSQRSDIEKIDALTSLNKKLGPPKPGEWLYEFKERGQSFEEYQTMSPVGATKVRKVIYLQPLGNFTAEQWKVVQLTRDYIALFFGLKTILSPQLSDSIIPSHARRVRGDGSEQLKSTYILDSLLLKRIPKDGIAYMAITAKDLYPKDEWSFVFGHANTQERVGVSSIFRYSKIPLDSLNYRYCLDRLTKTATHEIGHMFSVLHCTYAYCLMNGSNSFVESDQKPNHLCTDCLKKLCWNLKFDLKQRNAQLLGFFKAHRLEEEAAYNQKVLELLEK